MYSRKAHFLLWEIVFSSKKSISGLLTLDLYFYGRWGYVQYAIEPTNKSLSSAPPPPPQHAIMIDLCDFAARARLTISFSLPSSPTCCTTVLLHFHSPNWAVRRGREENVEVEMVTCTALSVCNSRQQAMLLGKRSFSAFGVSLGKTNCPWAHWLHTM